MRNASKKPNSFSVFNLAGDLILPGCEKTAIRAIANHVRKPDGYCNAANATLAEESGVSERRIRYGIHGRTKKDGSRYNAGLLERGLIFVDKQFSNNRGGRSNSVMYKVDLRNWLDYLPEHKKEQLETLHIDGTNPAQTWHKDCTTEEETRHNSENDAPVNPLDASKGGTNPAILPTKPLKKENQKIEASTPTEDAGGVARLQRIQFYFLGSERPSQIKKTDPIDIQRLEKMYGQKTVSLAYARFLKNDENTEYESGENRKYLISYFVRDSGQAEILAEQIKPWVDAGFSELSVIEFLDSMDTLPEVGALTFDEVSHLDSMKGCLMDKYGEFWEQHKYGTLKEFISYLNSEPQRTNEEIICQKS